jgi:hypothetical protein
MNMVHAAMASNFWAAVEDCLVQFHNMERDAAAETVTGLWCRLPRGATPEGEESSFEDMIYHAEPWYIACNLVGEELPLDQNRSRYEAVLKGRWRFPCEVGSAQLRNWLGLAARTPLIDGIEEVAKRGTWRAQLARAPL